MADVQEPKLNSLAERIAALNAQKNFTAPPSTGRRAPPPPPGAKKPSQDNNGISSKKSPALPARPSRREDPPTLPQRTITFDSNSAKPPVLPARNVPPPLPGRTNSSDSSPALPPRRSSTQPLNGRRGSNSSEVSQISTISGLSRGTASSQLSTTSTEPRRVLAPTFDQAKLPPLPPTRREREAQAANDLAEKKGAEFNKPVKAPLLPARSAPIIPQIEAAVRPSLPPRLPSRPAKSSTPSQANDSGPVAPRRLPPPPSAFIRSKTTSEPIQRPVVNSIQGGENDAPPPPVPLSSRPTFAQIDAVSVRATASQAPSCLVCRDFSGPDSVAAQYPSDYIPRNDPVGYLANVLCGPFPSPTDKARAIFVWCHHNIAYAVKEFLGKCVKRRSVEETIFEGLAVCQGYAEVFQAIANRAGLQCVVVGGHGKGYGYTPLAPGQSPPPRNATGHAWNAVCIDNGEWKLIDACWGAGSIGNERYNKHFSPEMFHLSNDLFGLKHFPENSQYFYRKDGRIPTWEEYVIGPIGTEKAQWYGTATEEGLSEFLFSPAGKHISVYSGEVVRFQFTKVCEHWDPERHGKGKSYLLLMKIQGVDGRKERLVPVDTDGLWWWTDIPACELGAPGQKIFLYALTVLNNKDARGVTKADYFKAMSGNGYSMSWAVFAQWELV
ncbi:hypothetical protein SLS62_002806 [Diatrype stigma]|uniref:Transglutaminase-like domain-containing protein n=1 Tax=Diatrype stigma TaxID=117547 RepID=A0AAN9YVE4_9PEZI